MDLDRFLTQVLGKSSQHQKFYHFTDRCNLPSIRQNGLLATAQLRSKGMFDKIKTGGDDNTLEQ
ncbi:hypothetical protein ACVWW2_007825 [Bradyrhizobium sp. LM4.3]